MTPDVHAALANARRCLDVARQVSTLPLPDVIGREAYLAAYHAACAYILARTGTPTRTHSGARTQLALLARSEPRIDKAFRRLLDEGYAMKSLADYGHAARGPVSKEEALAAIRTAEAMIATIAALVAELDPTP